MTADRTSDDAVRATAAAAAPDREGELLLFVLAAVFLAALGTVVVWGLAASAAERTKQLVADTADPTTYRATAGAPSDDPVAEYAAYFPDHIRAHAGDAIHFTNPTVEDPHSVTFGLEGDRSNQPPIGVGPEALAVVNAPCVSDVALERSTRTCAGVTDPSATPAFTGQAYYNSGIIPPSGGTFHLRLGEALAAGTYSFGCVVHPEQSGTLVVEAEGEPTQRQSSLDDAAEDLRADDDDALSAIAGAVASGAHHPPAGEVRAGVATARVSRNEFLPGTVEITEGETVTWTNGGSVPHVMVFGGGLAAAEALAGPPT
ncbi:MAG TPA: hypothetical protein VHK88_14640, partial [Aquihabitans sp.]|nr:hypothetical protein [Aquihabitans sp.]